MSKKIEPIFAKIDALNNITQAIYMAETSATICDINIINHIQNASVLIEKNKDLRQHHSQSFKRFESDLDSIKMDFINRCNCSQK